MPPRPRAPAHALDWRQAASPPELRTVALRPAPATGCRPATSSSGPLRWRERASDPVGWSVTFSAYTSVSMAQLVRRPANVVPNAAPHVARGFVHTSDVPLLPGR